MQEQIMRANIEGGLPDGKASLLPNFHRHVNNTIAAKVGVGTHIVLMNHTPNSLSDKSKRSMLVGVSIQHGMACHEYLAVAKAL
jgi:hypothetical protein